MELQDKIEAFKAEGVKIYGISYDPVDALKKFADEYDVTYSLLSDYDSTVIKKFGILNTLVKPDDREKHPATRRGFYGIPFPGTYVVDESGRVLEKFFQRSYATRDSAGSILNSALGKVLKHKEAPQTSTSNEHVKITAFLSDEVLRLEYASTLYVRFEVAKGLHIYGDPLPDGFIATEVTPVETKGLRLGTPEYPKTHPLEFTALDATLSVYEGVVDVAIPIVATADVLNWNMRNKAKSVKLDLKVRYQVCSDTVCYTPDSETLSLELPLGLVLTQGAKRN